MAQSWLAVFLALACALAAARPDNSDQEPMNIDLKSGFEAAEDLLTSSPPLVQEGGNAFNVTGWPRKFGLPAGSSARHNPARAFLHTRRKRTLAARARLEIPSQLTNQTPALTWEYTASESLVPSFRTFHVAEAIDHSGMLLHGGTDIEVDQMRATFTCMNDTWIFNISLNSWHMLTFPGTIPPGRARHTAVRMLNNDINVIAIFAGYGCSPTGNYDQRIPLDDLWVLELSGDQHAWRQIVPSGPRPSARHSHIATAIHNTTTMLVFGGVLGVEGIELGDLWKIDLNSNPPRWIQLTSILPSPSPRADMMATYLNTQGLWLVHGGNHNATVILNDTWVFNVSSSSWLQIATEGPPVAGGAVFRAHHTTPEQQPVMVVLGGMPYPRGLSVSHAWENGYFVETSSNIWQLWWTNNSYTWLSINQTYETDSGLGARGGLPSPRMGHTAVSIPSRDELSPLMLMFGGINTFSFDTLNDLWSLHNNSIWTPVRPADIPPPVSDTTLSRVNNTLYLVGGWREAYTEHTPTWAFDIPSRTWMILDPQTALRNRPGARASHSCEPCRLSGGAPVLVLFGGVYVLADGTWAYRNDTWLFLVADQLWQRFLGDGPSARAGHASASYNDQVFIHGGKDNVHAYGDTWVYKCDPARPGWQLLHESARNTAFRWTHVLGALVDSTGGLTLVVHGGRNMTRIMQETLMLPLAALGELGADWAQLPCQGMCPTGVAFATAIAAPSSRKLVVLGGAQSVVPSDAEEMDQFMTDDVYNFTSLLWELDLPTRRWQTLRTWGSLPPLIGHAAVMVNETSMAIFGGRAEDPDDYRHDMHTLTLGCNPGSYSPSWAHTPCMLCPVTHYSSRTGQTSCLQTCPEGTYSRMEGATDMSQCTQCDGETSCHGHGTCAVDINNHPQCTCEFWWSKGSADCSVPQNIIVIVCCLGGGLVLLGLGLLVRRRWARLQAERDSSYSLLRNVTEDLVTLKGTWVIRSEELSILRRIDHNSEGFFSEVFLADYQGRQVAVKRLRRHLSEGNPFISSVTNSFEREIAALRSLRHRNLVFFYGAGTSSNQPFLVIEYCEKGSLRSILSNLTLELPWARRLAYCRDVAAGMTFLHAQTPPHIHRDLKSANLLVTAGDVVKIADFGTMRLWELTGAHAPHTRGVNGEETYQYQTETDSLHSMSMTSRVGTLPWMAPEVLSGSPTYGLSVDVYSFGIVLWEVASRQLPFHTQPNLNSYDLLTRVTRGERPTMPADVPAPFEKLIRQCWDGDALARPPFARIYRILDDQL